MTRNFASRPCRQRQRGISLVLGLIMLILLTLLAISAFQASNVNLRIAGNMQVRQETLAAAQTAIETVLSTPAFIDTTTPPAAASVSLNGASYTVDFTPAPACRSVVDIPSEDLVPHESRRLRVHSELRASGFELGNLSCERAAVRAVVLLEHALGGDRPRGRRQHQRRYDSRTGCRRSHGESQGAHQLSVGTRLSRSSKGKTMKLNKSLFAATALTLALATHSARSEDIDLYTGGSSGGDANVLIVLDNNSNWAATMDSNPPADAIPLPAVAEGCGLVFLRAEIRADHAVAEEGRDRRLFVGDNVGIGSDDVSAAATNKGGYIRFGVRKMTDANRAALIKLLKNLDMRSATRAPATRTLAG